MTVPVQPAYAIFHGDNTSPTFTLPFYFQQSTDLEVWLNGTPQVLGTHYSVYGAGAATGGQITFVTPPPSGAFVLVVNAPPITQNTTLQNYVSILENVLENSLDRQTLISANLAFQIENCLGLNPAAVSQAWLGAGLELQNIANGASPTSAATVAQIQAIVAAAGNVVPPLAGDAGKSLVASGAGAFNWSWPQGDLLGIIEEQQASGTGGGNGASQTWTNRALNAKIFDRLSNITLASNQFTLVAGAYEIAWDTTFNIDGVYNSRLFNVTGNAIVAQGIAGRGDRSSGNSNGVTYITPGVSTTYALQYYLGVAAASQIDTLGQACSAGTEVYSRVVIRKA